MIIYFYIAIIKQIKFFKNCQKFMKTAFYTQKVSEVTIELLQLKYKLNCYLKAKRNEEYYEQSLQFEVYRHWLFFQREWVWFDRGCHHKRWISLSLFYVMGGANFILCITKVNALNNLLS